MALYFGNTISGSSWWQTRGDEILAGRFSVDAGASISAISAYLDGNGTSHPAVGSQAVRAVLYGDTTGYPGAWIGSSLASSVADGAAAAWKEFTFSPEQVVVAGTYWLVLMFDTDGGDSDGGIIRAAYDPGGTTRYRLDTDYTAGAPSPFPGSAISDTALLSLFATYTLTDLTSPQVLVTAPVDGATISGAAVAVTANATDDVGVSRVDFLMDSLVFSSDSSGPYTATLDTTPYEEGAHLVGARAVDAAGNTALHTVTANVNNITDTVAPYAAVLSPSAGATLTGQAAVVVGFGDGCGVERVQLRLDGVAYGDAVTDRALLRNLVSATLNPSYETATTTWAGVLGTESFARSNSAGNFFSGAYGLGVTVPTTAGAGLRHTTAALTAGAWYVVRFTVKYTASVAMSLRARSNGGTLLASTNFTATGSWQEVTLAFQASASNAHLIDLVKVNSGDAGTFYADDASVRAALSMTLPTGLRENGAHTLAARVFDGDGNASDSATVSVTFLNEPVPFPTVIAEIGLAGDAYTAEPTWTDISAYVLEFGSKRGAQADLRRIETGTLSLVVDSSADERFNPMNDQSPYFPGLTIGRPVRVRATIAGSTTGIFRGVITDIQPEQEGVWDSSVRIDAIDALGVLDRDSLVAPRATFTWAPAGDNNDLVFASRQGGGDDISVQMIDLGYATSTADPVVVNQTVIAAVGATGQTGGSTGLAVQPVWIVHPTTQAPTTHVNRGMTMAIE